MRPAPCERRRRQDLAQRLVHRAVDVEKSAGGNRAAARSVRPENVAAAVGLPEDRDEEVPRRALEEPADEGALAARSRDQVVADLSQLLPRLVDRDFPAHGVLTESRADLSLELARPARERSQLIVRSPVDDLDPVPKAVRKHQRHVDREDPATAALEIRPEGFAVEPVGGQAPELHPIRVPLEVVVDPVRAGTRRRVEGGPHGPGQEVGGRANRVQRPARQDRCQVRQRARGRPDEAEVRRVQADHGQAAGGAHAGRFARLASAAERAAASIQRTFSTASSKPGEKGAPEASARRNESSAVRIVNRVIVRSRASAR